MSSPYQHSEFSRCVAEATGTFFLVLTVGCNVMVMSGGGSLSIGGMLMVMIYSLGSVSGAHFNPAVTLAVYLSGRGIITLKEMFLYMLSQNFGALFAGLLYEVIFQGSFLLKPVDKYSVPTVMAVEFLYTLALCYVVLNVATTASQKGNQYFGLAIGFSVVSAAIAIANISNCCLNPAVAFGSIIAAVVDQGPENISVYYIYFIMPFLGGVFGALAFYLVRRKDEYEPKGLGLFLLSKPDQFPSSANVSPVNASQVGLTNSDDETPR